MGNIWDSHIPRIVNGVTSFSETDINPIIDAIEERTSALKTSIDGLNGQCGYIATLSGFSSDCRKGTIVALDSDGIYKPATAAWSADGLDALAPSPLARIVGVLLEDVSSSGNAAVLCDGWINDPELIAILTKNAGTGTYYLTSNGAADITPPKLGVIVPCFTYVDGGYSAISRCLIFRPQAPEYNGHTHNTYKVTGTWTTGLIEAEVPESILEAFKASGNASKLAISANPELQYVVGSNSDHLVLVKNGLIMPPDSWCISGGYIYVAVSIMDSDTIYVGAIYPLVGTSPIVRSIESSNKLLEVYNRGGDITLALNTTPASDNDVTGYAVSTITSDGISTAPVVNRIYPGVAVTISNRRDEYNNIIPGSFEIHSTAALEKQLDFNITNLNGVLLGTDAEMVSYVFPAVDASLCGTIRVPKFNATAVNCRINILARGNGSSIDDFVAKISSNTMPGIGGSAPLAAVASTTIDGVSGTSANNIYRLSAELPAGMIKSDDFVSITLSSNQSSSVSVLTVSLELFTS